MKKIISLLAAGLLMVLCSMTVFAADKDTVVALGADLDADQRAEVLELMGLTEDDLANCTVVTVTNSDEHEYLDDYIDSSVIGTKALTSVKMTKADKGSGINVTTQNVNYCTTGMYRNALLTAGVEDRNILVVAPYPVSGTAGLIGAVKAYEASSGDDISDNAIDTAMDEMITTGDIAEAEANISSEDVEALIAWLKGMVASGELDTSDEQSIRDCIDKGKEKFGVELNDSEEDRIVALLKKMDTLGLSGSYLVDQAEDLYEKYGSDIIDHTSEAVSEAVDNAVDQAKKSFMDSLKESVTSFFSGLFGGKK